MTSKLFKREENFCSNGQRSFSMCRATCLKKNHEKKEPARGQTDFCLIPTHCACADLTANPSCSPLHGSADEQLRAACLCARSCLSCRRGCTEKSGFFAATSNVTLPKLQCNSACCQLLHARTATRTTREHTARAHERDRARARRERGRACVMT